jgi:hypothetical protein
MSIDRQCRKGTVGGEHQIHSLARPSELWIVQRPLSKCGSVSRRKQQSIPLAKRNLQLLGQVEDHLTTGHRTARLHVAQVPS